MLNGKKELVETKYHPDKGDFVPNVYYEFETGRAIVFRRKEDGKITYIPKTLIKGGFHRRRDEPQDISLVPYCTIPFYWVKRKVYYD